MSKYKEITAARQLLELPETATIASIKSSYRKLMARWHPDKCQENQITRTEMTRNIIVAYQTIMDYCRHYQYSFSEEAVKRHRLPEDWWFERFGDDPLWGNSMKPK
ncbi:MAG: J domain-containing protein [Desulfobacteraceae bacterium]|nr:MAG: J domain-containing protein [Desulfobacteraceae bacterium]